MRQDTLMLITDISGYTRFVTEVGHDQALTIAHDLLQTVINANTLGLKLCEVEGDAVFFYSTKALPSYKALMRQIGRTYRAFHYYLGRHALAAQLGIKFFVHTGLCEEMQIGGRTKLFGAEVIKIHRLLKSIPDQSDYLLMTSNARETFHLNADDGSDGVTGIPYIGDVQYSVYDGTYILEASAEPQQYSAVVEYLADAGRLLATELGRQYQTYRGLFYPVRGMLS